jgi:Xaa-Pro aminopeptidase
MLAHPEGAGTPLQAGQVWRTDVGARFEGGILSDIARCGVVGPPDAAQRAAFALLRDAQRAAFAAIAPGRRAADVYLAARECLRAGGHDLEIPHVGHGIGIGPHEAPILHPGNEHPLLPGMVINVEPILFHQDRREAYHTEDLVLVTDDGCLPLTTPQAELLEVRL